jgi:ATP-dependent DNA helicase RecG
VLTDESMTESNRIEYKRELTASLEREVVAFLNYHDGGIIYLGIDDDESVVGVQNCDAVQLVVKDRLKNNILPSCMGLFDVIHEQRNGKEIIKIIVAGGSEKPYYLKKYGMSEKGCFLRVGSAAEPMTVRMIEDLFARRTRNSLTRIRSPRQDLTFGQLRIFYEEAGFELGNKFASNLELLTEDGGTTLPPICWPTKMGTRFKWPNMRELTGSICLKVRNTAIAA